MKNFRKIIAISIVTLSGGLITSCDLDLGIRSKVKVSFIVEENVYRMVEIDKNTTVKEINAPTIANKTFQYWAKDLLTKEKFDFSTIISEDTNIYAYYKDKDSGDNNQSGGDNNQGGGDNNQTGNTGEGYTKLNKENVKFTYDDVFQSQYLGVVPSKGSPHVLVVPVEFSDQESYKFNSTNLQTLNATFNGNKSDHTNDYRESVRSFYYKSSYGALDINFDITDVYTPSISSSTFVTLENDETNEGCGTAFLVKEFYNNGKINGKKINFNNKIYDSNGDEYVDGVWFVYNNRKASDKNNYWPYVYWYYPETEADYNINISAYGNCSAHFMYEDSSIGQDYHTFVHETGHMLGLNDYYDSTSSSQLGATGGLDMMDFNIGDHNSFSKFALGWTSPYIVNKECEITLKPFVTSGESIILANSFNNSAFSEYIIVEYYTPTYLNEFDATNTYTGRDLYFSQNGVRIYHIDARLGKFTNTSNSSFTGEILSNDATKIPTIEELKGNYYYDLLGDNSLSRSYDGKSPLVELITRGNTKLANKRSANNRDLFITGDTFNKTNQKNFFNNGKLHDGSSFDYQVKIGEMTSEGVKITITK